MSRLLLVAAIWLSSIPLKAQKLKDAEVQEDSAYAALETVPEVQQMIKDDTGKVWHLTMRTVQRPTHTFQYYWIEVGHTNGQRMVTQFHFYVKPPAMDVYYLDPKTEALYTPTKWRASGK